MKRFILIEDNRIIDITNLPYNEEYIIEEIDGEECLEFYDFFPDTEEQYYWSCYKIIKQSDNVFDLIECGKDYITINNSNVLIQPTRLIDKNLPYNCWKEEIWGKAFKVIGSNREMIKFEEITKIYKPNSNRGYDLVWEKKE